MPPGVDPGDFIVSGGKIATPLPERVAFPSGTKLIEEHLAAQFRKADSSVGTERTHLSNLKKSLTDKAT